MSRPWAGKFNFWMKVYDLELWMFVFAETLPVLVVRYGFPYYRSQGNVGRTS